MSDTSGWQIVSVSGLAEGASYSLTEMGIHMGRADECDLVLPSQNVSRKHARVFIYQNEPYVQDLGSRNGLFVNGVRVQQQGLQNGDTLTMGEFVFRVANGQGTAKSGGKKGLYVVAAVVLLGAIGAIGAIAIRSGPPVTPQSNGGIAVKGVQAPVESGVGGMLASLEKAERKPAAGDANSGSSAASAQGQRASAAAIANERRNRMVREYLDRAQLLQDAGKLTEASEQYERALTLDPACRLCLTRKDRLEKGIAALVQRHLDGGMKAFKALRYAEAISSWELVMNLSPDPGSPAHQQALRYIENANTKLNSQRY